MAKKRLKNNKQRGMTRRARSSKKSKKGMRNIIKIFDEND